MRSVGAKFFFVKNLVNSQNWRNFAVATAEIAQLVEHDLAKVGVAGSSPVFRSKENFNIRNRHIGGRNSRK